MRKNILWIALVCSLAHVLPAQTGSSSTDELSRQIRSQQNRISQLQNRQRQQQNQIATLRAYLLRSSQQLDSLTEVLHQHMQQINQSLTTQQDQLRTEFKEDLTQNSQSLLTREHALNRKTNYWLAGLGVVLLLGLLLYGWTRQRLQTQQQSFTERLTHIQQGLRQEDHQADEKLLQLIDTQLALVQRQQESGPSANVDHSLAIKVADEIVRIEKNISRMDDGTKGLKQLSRAVGRIRDNFAAHGYEMVDMVGKTFDEGMKVTPIFVLDESLAPGERKITRIIKPQINYQGTMLQAAQVEVSQGE